MRISKLWKLWKLGPEAAKEAPKAIPAGIWKLKRIGREREFVMVYLNEAESDIEYKNFYFLKADLAMVQSWNDPWIKDRLCMQVGEIDTGFDITKEYLADPSKVLEVIEQFPSWLPKVLEDRPGTTVSQELVKVMMGSKDRTTRILGIKMAGRKTRLV